MPWCPKCKNEYRKGFTTCSECNIPLVDKIDEVEYYPLCTFSCEELAEKVKKYFEYSKIDYKYENYGEENAYYILVNADNIPKGKAALAGFLKVEKDIYGKMQIDSSAYIGYISEIKGVPERDLVDNNVLEEDIDEVMKDKKAAENMLENLNRRVVTGPSTVYQSKSFKAEEMSSSAIILIGFGVVGIAFAVLNMFGVLNILNNGFSLYVMLGMFILFFLGGIYSLKSSNQYAVEAIEEDKISEDLNNWLKTSINPDDIKKVDSPDCTPEENYLARTAYLKELVMKNFPYIAEDHAEALIEDYYNNTFED